MTLVKICGVRTPEAARVVAEAGADLMGLIFAPARRQVTVEAAREIVAAARESERAPLVVGVFVNEAPERMAAVTEAVGLDLIQLSGDEPPEVVAALPVPALKVLRLPAGTSVAAAGREAARYGEALVPPAAFMLDAHVPGSYGGNGVVGDWELAAELVRELPLLLAGGLHAGIVGSAVTRVRPLGVDVSSGVETGGAKDHDKIRAFVATVRSASPDRQERADQLLLRAAARSV